MNKLKLFSFAFLTIVLVLVICFGSNVAQATTMAAVPDVDQHHIKKLSTIILIIGISRRRIYNLLIFLLSLQIHRPTMT